MSDLPKKPPEQKTITFDRVLLVGGEGAAKIGNPVVAGATVTADVLGPVAVNHPAARNAGDMGPCEHQFVHASRHP